MVVHPEEEKGKVGGMTVLDEVKGVFDVADIGGGEGLFEGSSKFQIRGGLLEFSF